MGLCNSGSFQSMEIISFALPYHFSLQNFSVKNRTNPSEFRTGILLGLYAIYSIDTLYGVIDFTIAHPIFSLKNRRKFSTYENFLGL